MKTFLHNLLNPNSTICRTIILLWVFFGFLFTQNLAAQNFTRLTIENDVTWSRGIGWIDFDNDGDQDLYVTYNNFNLQSFNSGENRNKLFRNDGNDTFVATRPLDMANDTSYTIGQTWADYDNDGNIDLYAANLNSIYENSLNIPISLGSELFNNLGPQNYDFMRIVTGDISSINRIPGFAAAWADYNNDGFVDLFVTTPSGGFYPNETMSNVLFDNNGDGTFTKNTANPAVTLPVGPYTIPSWSDYDMDGDMDLYLASGPTQTGVTGPDFFFKNMLAETGSATFEQDMSSSFATDTRDAQQVNWIDYDNDGDLDLYITNFGGTPGIAPGTANDLYRNDDGTYTKITSGPHVSDSKISLGQTWGDFDNDGDLDLYVTNLTSPLNFGGNNYYRNDGAPDYTFTRVTAGDFVAGNRAGWGASSADYDKDGDLDMYVTFNSLTSGAARDALYRNDLTNGNNWLNVHCIGTQSNRSAIGARVRIKATISGFTYWQMREISSQNASTGQNSLHAHFGIGDATTIDSLVIDWPSGIQDVFINPDPNTFITVMEGETITSIDTDIRNSIAHFELGQNYPNPFNPATTIRFSLHRPGQVTLRVYDLQGKEIATLIEDNLPLGEHAAVFDAGNLPSGVYVYRLITPTHSQARKAMLLK